MAITPPWLGTSGSEEDPVWSPDGTRIAFVHSAVNGDPEHVDFAAPNGSDRTHIYVEDGTITPFRLDWQPIVNRPPNCSTVTASPAVIDPAGSQLRLTSLSGATDPDGDAVRSR